MKEQKKRKKNSNNKVKKKSASIKCEQNVNENNNNNNIKEIDNDTNTITTTNTALDNNNNVQVLTNEELELCPELGYFWISNCNLNINDESTAKDFHSNTTPTIITTTTTTSTTIITTTTRTSSSSISPTATSSTTTTSTTTSATTAKVEKDCEQEQQQEEQKQQQNWININIIKTNSQTNDVVNENVVLNECQDNNKINTKNNIVTTTDNNNVNQKHVNNINMNSKSTSIENEIYNDQDCNYCQINLMKEIYDNNNNNNDKKSDNMYSLDLNNIMYYDGTVQNVNCIYCHKKRSDISLLFGMLRYCSEILQIKKCSFIISTTNHHDDNSNINNNNIILNNNNILYEVVITVTFPSLFLQQPDYYNKRSIVPNNLNNKKKIVCLHSATQCLLSIIQSDWINMENRMLHYLTTNSQNNINNRIQNPKIFPNKLTFDEVYKHIHEYSNLQNNINNTNQYINNEKQYNEHKINLFQLLSNDTLVLNLVSYLQSKSLYNLRCTCKYLYNTLINVVPGLNTKTIKLYKHQISSLQWMRKREIQNLYEYDYLYNNNNENENSILQEDDYHRSITGGCTTRLVIRSSCTTPSTNELSTNVDAHPSVASIKKEDITIDEELPIIINESSIIRIEQLTGKEILIPNLNQRKTPDTINSTQFSRSIARGGLLCDDPGLGKTITVLSLILQTYGLTTERIKKNNVSSCNKSTTDTQYDNDTIFNVYWTEQVVPAFRIPALLKLLNDLLKLDRYRILNISVFKNLKVLVSNDQLGSDFNEFRAQVENEIKLSLSQASMYDDSIEIDRLLTNFRFLAKQLKEKQLQSAKKSFSNAKSKPNSVVANLVEKEKRQLLTDSLETSAATLLVIPQVLMDHWQTQINLHVDLKYCTGHNKLPLIFEFNTSSSMTVNEATKLCKIMKTHTPVIFLDKSGTRQLPPPEFLAMFRIVITTTNRFMYEWKHGSFEAELDQNTKRNYNDADYDNMYTKSTACPLLKIHWLRMVVDEGHSMGNGKTSSTIQFASWIQAERRWVMTGTPTKQTVIQISQVLNLLNFLQHNFFSSQSDGNTWWRNNIAKNWTDGNMVSFFRLSSLLGFLMKRHTKLDIAELDPPDYEETKVPMSFAEATTYNTLVTGVQSNILITSMDGTTSGLQDSLLHRSQGKSARLALANIRRVCVGWAFVIPTLSDKFYDLTMQFANVYGLSDSVLSEIREFLWRAQNEELSECGFCSIRLSILLLMPCCGAMVCSECMDSSFVSCLICDNPFCIDDFQKFQPGFQMEWKSNLESISKAISSPERQAHVHSNMLENTSDSDDDAMPIRPLNTRIRTKRVGDGHQCEYDSSFSDGRCKYCLEEHAYCNFFNPSNKCLVCQRLGEECPESESKSSYLIQRILEIMKSPISSNKLVFHGKDEPRPLKVIVFSQYRAALNFVGHRLLRKFGDSCISEYFGKHRSKELHRFTYENDCFCLLLTKDGSEGLDLSFVTNIFFLEQIYDVSLKDQAVARAWRMGASGSVMVETLIADKSVEVEMNRLDVASRDSTAPLSASLDSSLKPIEVDAVVNDAQKVKTLLLSLRLMTDYHHFGNSHLAKEIDANNNKDTSKTNENIQNQILKLQNLKTEEDDKKVSGRRVRFQNHFENETV